MYVGLLDVDNTGFPNLALMKLSAWHKQKGDYVAWYDPFLGADVVHASKVFTWTPYNAPCDNINAGGTGFGFHTNLPDEVEHVMPDYALYNTDCSYGFLTRGCPNKCAWCVVPKKEGEVRAHADVSEFLAHGQAVFMDNNVLAHDHGIQQIEKIATLGIKVDFNQGLDARRVDEGVARRLAALKWLKPLRLACDTSSQMAAVQKAVQLLRWHNCTPRAYFVYVLVKDVEDALERVRFLKGLGVDPFAQPYRDFTTNAEPTGEQKAFARWVNHKAVFKSTTWEDYRDNRRKVA